MYWNRLSYQILDLKNPSSQPAAQLEEAYSFWKAQWIQFITEHKLDEHLFSDEFTRADAAGVLYYDNKIASIILFKERDITLNCWRDDSYFKVWPSHIVEQLTQSKTTKVMSAGYLTVHPLMRGEHFKPSLKNIMVALVGLHLTHTSADAAICVTNNLKGVNSSTERCGWNMVATGLEHFHHPVNLYVLTQDHARESLMEDSEINQVIHSLYPISNIKKIKMA